MFSETVRFNLDPFKENSDEVILEVLESINMKNTILNLPNKLDEKVAEGGDNFSAGQRQVTLSRPSTCIILTCNYCSLWCWFVVAVHRSNHPQEAQDIDT